MDEIIGADTIDPYNNLYGLEIMDPLVRVVDLTEATTFLNNIRMNMSVYSLFLKQTLCGNLKYGKKYNHGLL